MMEGSRTASVSQSQSVSSVSGSVSLSKETVTRETRETSVKSQGKTSKAIDNSGVQMMVLPLIKHKDKELEPLPLPSGWLSLKHLNTLLLRYIGIVHDLEEGKVGEGVDGTINIDIDEKEVKSHEKQYQQYEDTWNEEKEKANARIKELEAKIKKLEIELAALIARGAEYDTEIVKKQKKIDDLRMEVSRLQAALAPLMHQDNHYLALLRRLQGHLSFLTGELGAVTKDLQAEELRGVELQDRLDSLLSDLKFKLQVLETELKCEMEKTSMDISSMDIRIKGEFINRLKVEVDILRGTYEEFMRTTWESLEEEFKDDLAKLELKLTLVLSQQTSQEDIVKISEEIEKLKVSVEKLQKSNEELTIVGSNLTVTIHKEEATFRAEMSAKEKEIDAEIREIEKRKEKVEELRKWMMEERVEVKVYDKLLTPEMQRMKKRHSSVGGAI